MLSIHTTEKAFENIILTEKYPNWLAISKKQNKITLAVEAESECLYDDNNPIYIFCMSNDIELISDKDYIDSISNNYDKVLDEPCGAFILNINMATAQEIQSGYGVICQDESNIDDNVLVYQKDASCIKDETCHNWDEIFNDIKSQPTNTLIINDRFLFSHDLNGNGVGIDNVVKIIDSILPELFENSYHIFIAFSHDKIKPSMSFGKISTALNKKIKTLRAYNIILEIVSYDKNCYMYEYTHNRRILTNYHLVKADHLCAAFDSSNKSIVDQTITCEMLYSHGLFDNSDVPAKTHKSMIKRFEEMIKYGKEHLKSGYNYSCNGNSNVEITSFQNRLLN